MSARMWNSLSLCELYIICVTSCLIFLSRQRWETANASHVNENEHVIAITALHYRLQLLLIHRNVPSSYIIHVALSSIAAACAMHLCGMYSCSNCEQWRRWRAKNVENYFLWQRCLFALELWKSNHPYRVSWKIYQYTQQINIDGIHMKWNTFSFLLELRLHVRINIKINIALFVNL